MEDDCTHYRHPPQGIHLPPQCSSWVLVGEGYGHSQIGGQVIPTYGRNLPRTPVPGVLWCKEELQISGQNAVCVS